MPQNNGNPPLNSAPVGSVCSGTYAYGSYSGTVFNRLAGKYCLFNAPSEQTDFAQAFPFTYELSTSTTEYSLDNSCQVDPNDPFGTHALAIGSLNPGTTYAPATKIPTFGWDGQPLSACLDVASVQSVITGSGAASNYYINFTILAADDFTTKLR
jgi:hypothetical protein